MNELSTIDIDAMQFDIPKQGDMVPAAGGPMMISTTRGIVTAQRVAVPRDMGRLMQTVKSNCAAFGQAYTYSWDVKDRANGRKQTVEGGTIKLANMLARAFGNCHIGVEVENTQTHTIFTAIFTDLETGFTMERPFQQRKSMNIGAGYDDARKADMAFQVGVSKAIRNVVLNALPDLAAFAVEEAKKALSAWLTTDGNKDKAWTFIGRVMTDHGIDIKQVEAVVGRPSKDWTLQNLAKVLTEMRAIEDGFAPAAEVYPSLDKAAEVADRKSAKDRMDELAKPESSADKPKKAEPKAPPKDEPPHDPDTGEIDEDKPAATKSPDPREQAEAPADEDDSTNLFGAD